MQRNVPRHRYSYLHASGHEFGVGNLMLPKKKKKKRPLCQGSCTDIYNLLRCSQVLRTNPVLNNQVISILGTW